MKAHVRALVAVSLAALALPLAAGEQSRAETIFREALMMERAEGKLRDAIFRYERVVAEFPSERAVVTQALHKLALVYERLRDPRARLMWSRLAAGAENPYSAEARSKVKAAQAQDAAGPFATRPLEQSYDAGSPDGRWVLLHREPGRVHVRDLATDAERVLIDLDGQVGAFAWSPDSRELAFAFSNNVQGIRDIRIVSVETGAIRSLAQRGYPLAWTRRDELFAYRPNYTDSRVDLYLVPLRGGEARKVFSDPTDACGWAIVPDGGSLVTCHAKRLVLRDLASGAEQPITGGSGEEASPVVSRDGRLVAFKSNEEGKWAVYVAPLGRLPVQRPLRIATIDDDAVLPPRSGPSDWWTDEGLLTLRLGHLDTNIYRVDMDPKTGRAIDSPRRLTQDTPANLLPSINTDSSRIAYFYAKGSGGGIAVMDASGLNERPLIEQGGRLPLSWRSPSELLFHNFGASGTAKAAIAALNVETGAISEIAKVEGLYWSFVPARREILHWYPRGGGFAVGAELKAYSLADGKDRIVARIDFLSTRLAVSPDGRRIAYSVAPSGNAAKGCELALMSIDGTREKVLTPLQSCRLAVAWSPDGRFLLLNTMEGPMVMNVETAAAWPVHPDVLGAAWEAGTWAPDGSFVTLTRSLQRTERLAWEGVTFDAVTGLLVR